MYRLLTISFFLLSTALWSQKITISGYIHEDGKGDQLSNVLVYVAESSSFATSDAQGYYQLVLEEGVHQIEFLRTGLLSHYIEIELQSDTTVDIQMKTLSVQLEDVEIRATRTSHGIQRLDAVDNMGIYASKKNEVIVLGDFALNKTANTARQVFAKVPGLNIWESDFAGLQLDIAARGLGPSRSSHFNTRQNGYDMSADALGYPESYYMPALQAVDRIEVVRGAASLQYGTQLGGMLNFRIKEAPLAPIQLIVDQSMGSFGLLNSFGSIGGRSGKMDYYGYYQYRQGDGWRDNSGFDSHTAFGRVGYQASPRLRIGLEYSYLQYEAQQPGGLTDEQFESGQLWQSNRDRNWFGVTWNLAAATLYYDLDSKSRLSMKTFVLFSQRDALGNLQQIGVPDDPNSPRTLIRDEFRNIGMEVKFQTHHQLLSRSSTLIVGGRYYNGMTDRLQGLASMDKGPEFDLLTPENPEEFDYDFPSQNYALFAENLIQLSPKWNLTLGGRLDYIRTDAEGVWKDNRYDFAGNLISSTTHLDRKSQERWVPLVGIGINYDVHENGQWYLNYSRNFRSITFSDLRVVNPNFQLDSLITDERGFNFDIGYRGRVAPWMKVDISAYYLCYAGRIGSYELPGSTTLFRTNIGDSRHVGIEVYGEADLWSLLDIESNRSSFSAFVNLALTDAEYVESDITAIRGKRVEYVPSVMLRTGFNYRWKGLKTSLLFSHLGEQFSDATNSVFNPNALTGLIPSYTVLDFSAEYCWDRWKVYGGLNNITNEHYFTRRAESYPGPGIIPATPRSGYVGFGVRL